MKEEQKYYILILDLYVLVEFCNVVSNLVFLLLMVNIVLVISKQNQILVSFSKRGIY